MSDPRNKFDDIPGDPGIVDSLRTRIVELEAELANSCNAEELYQTRKSNSRLLAEAARLTSEVREWLCDSCNTIYTGPPQKGVWCVVCPKCGGNTAPTKIIELRKARARVAELEAENNDLIIKVQFAESVIRDEKQIERTATEAALRWAWRNHPQLEYPTSDDLEDFVSTGLAALLNETNNQGETK